MNQDYNTILYPDVLLCIEKFLDYPSLVKLMFVCKRFYDVFGPRGERKKLIARMELEYILNFFKGRECAFSVPRVDEEFIYDSNEKSTFTYKGFQYSIQLIDNQTLFVVQKEGYEKSFELYGDPISGKCEIANCECLDSVILYLEARDCTPLLNLVIHKTGCILWSQLIDDEYSDDYGPYMSRFQPLYYRAPHHINQFIDSNPCENLNFSNSEN